MLEISQKIFKKIIKKTKGRNLESGKSSKSKGLDSGRSKKKNTLKSNNKLRRSR